MPVKPQHSLLIATVGLVAVIWLLGQLSEWLHQSFLLSVLVLLGLGGLALSAWRRPQKLTFPSPSSVSSEAVYQVLAETEQVLDQLKTEAGDSPLPEELGAGIQTVRAELSRQAAQLLLLGGKSVGKTTLLRLLAASWQPPGQPSPSLIEGPSLFAAGGSEPILPGEVLTADLVLFLIQGDLTQLEYQALQVLKSRQQRTIVVLNKQDQYLPAERSLVIQQIQQRLQGIIEAPEVLAIAAQPRPIQVRQHQADGSLREWQEAPPPQIEALTQRLDRILAQETPRLILQTALDQALALKQAAAAGLNQSRRQRALPLIERYQWLSAATAFANPVPALDVLAAAAISGKMVSELAALYQQPLSWEQAKTLAAELVKLMLQFGVVEFSSQTLSSLLKSHSLTFVAGGLIQGVSAAYLARLAGLSLIEYFQDQPLSTPAALDQGSLALAQRLQQVFQQNQRLAFLQALAQEALTRLRQPTGQPSSTKPVALNPSLPTISPG